MSKKNPKAPKGPAKTAVGTLPPQTRLAHKLTDEPILEHSMEAKEIASGIHRRTMKNLVQITKGYRLTVHGVMQKHLASPLVEVLRYFCDRQKVPSRNQDREEPQEDSVKSAFAQPAEVR
jgi:hypothetical protein